MSYATFACFNVDLEQEGTCLQTDYDIIDCQKCHKCQNDALYQHLLLHQPWFLWALVCGLHALVSFDAVADQGLCDHCRRWSCCLGKLTYLPGRRS